MIIQKKYIGNGILTNDLTILDLTNQLGVKTILRS